MTKENVLAMSLARQIMKVIKTCTCNSQLGAFCQQAIVYCYHELKLRYLNGCGMGPLPVLISHCFPLENVVVTCKSVSFLCNLDDLLQKNVIVFFFENQISKWCSFEKRAIFDLLFTFFSYQGKDTKILSVHTLLTYIRAYMYFAHPIDFFALPILKKIRIYQVWFLFGVIPGVDSYSHHFGTINK